MRVSWKCVVLRTSAALFTVLRNPALAFEGPNHLTRPFPMPQPARVNVILPEAEAKRFDVYCKTKGFKKSTLIVRLIREHLEREKDDTRFSGERRGRRS